MIDLRIVELAKRETEEIFVVFMLLNVVERHLLVCSIYFMMLSSETLWEIVVDFLLVM